MVIVCFTTSIFLRGIHSKCMRVIYVTLCYASLYRTNIIQMYVVYALALLDCIFRRLHADISSNTSRLFVRASNYMQKDETTLLIFAHVRVYLQFSMFYQNIFARLIIILLRATIIKLHYITIYYTYFFNAFSLFK